MIAKLQLIILLNLVIATAATAQGADAAWHDLELAIDPISVNNVYGPNLKEDPIALWRVREVQRRFLRERGVEFYNRFPSDPRRWVWLVATVSSPPDYYLDAHLAIESASGGKLYDGPVASAEKAAWERAYLGMRREFLSDASVPDSQKEQLYFFELQGMIPALVRSGRAGADVSKADVDTVVAKLVEFADDLPDSDRPRGFVMILFLFADALHLDLEEKRAIAGRLAKVRNKAARDVAVSMQNLLELHRTPMNLRGATLDGGSVDISDYRGKVVLVEFWASWCANCIAEIPNLKAVYEKYKERGFAIIGVALDEDKNRGKLESLIASHGIEWPQIFSGKGLYDDENAKKLGIIGVPAMLLLRDDGTLVTTDLRGEKLEAAVQALLEK